MIADYRSETWRFLVKHIEGRIDHLRKQNDGLALNQDQTNILRGRIAELKSILELPEKGKPLDHE